MTLTETSGVPGCWSENKGAVLREVRWGGGFLSMFDGGQRQRMGIPSQARLLLADSFDERRMSFSFT